MDKQKLMELVERLYAHCNTDRSDALTNEAADALIELNLRNVELQAELDRVKPPCEVGAIVRGKNGKWSGEVTELSVNSDGWFLYVDYGNGYRGLHRPDEVLFSTRKEG